jgi:hypothetical protein
MHTGVDESRKSEMVERDERVAVVVVRRIVP